MKTLREQYIENPQLFGEFPARIVVEMMKYLTPGGRVLDVGAGQGRNTLSLARQGFQVDAIDREQSGVDQLREQINSLNIQGIRTKVGTIEELALEDATYDGFCFVNVLHFLAYESACEVIKKCQQATKQQGVHAITLFAEGTSDIVQRWRSQPRFWTQAEIASLYQGWSIEKNELLEGRLAQRGEQGEVERSMTVQFLARKLG